MGLYTLSNRRPGTSYADLVRAEAPLAKSNYYKVLNRQLQEKELEQGQAQHEAELALLAEQFNKKYALSQEQFDTTLEQSQAEFDKTLEQLYAQLEQGQTQHEETLAANTEQFTQQYGLEQKQIEESKKQADYANKMALLGLGIEAAPYAAKGITALTGLGLGGGSAAAPATAAVGTPAAAGYTATGGTAASASSGTTAATGMSAGLGAATAIGIPLAIAIGSGHFKQLGKGDTPGIDELWHTYTPEQKEAFVNSGKLNAQQLQWVAYNDTDFYKTHPEMQNQLRQNVMTEESGRPGAYSFTGPAWKGITEEEKSQLTKDLTKGKHSTRMRRFDES